MHSEYPVEQDVTYASGVNKELMKTITKCLQIPPPPLFFLFVCKLRKIKLPWQCVHASLARVAA